MNLGKMKSLLTRRMAIPAIVAGTLIAAGGWALVRPASAAAAPNPAPAAAPIDESSVAPLLSFDQAMEALTARVRPAVVNVSVTSKLSQRQTSEEEGAEGTAAAATAVPAILRSWLALRSVLPGSGDAAAATLD